MAQPDLPGAVTILGSGTAPPDLPFLTVTRVVAVLTGVLSATVLMCCVFPTSGSGKASDWTIQTANTGMHSVLRVICDSGMQSVKATFK